MSLFANLKNRHSRVMVPKNYKRNECFRAFRDLMAESHTEAVFRAFIEGSSIGTLALGDSPSDRYKYITVIRDMRKLIGRKIGKGASVVSNYPPLVIKGGDYDMRMIDAKEGNPPKCLDMEGVAGEHILCFDLTSDGSRIFSGSSTPFGEIIVWDSKIFPKKVLHRMPHIGWVNSNKDKRIPFHQKAVTCVRVINDAVLVSTSLDGKFCVWGNLSSPTVAPTLLHMVDDPIRTNIKNTIAPVLPTGPIGVNCLAVCPLDDEYITPATGQFDGWVATAKDDDVVQKKGATIVDNPQAYLLFLGGDNGSIDVWTLLPASFTETHSKKVQQQQQSIFVKKTKKMKLHETTFITPAPQKLGNLLLSSQPPDGDDTALIKLESVTSLIVDRGLLYAGGRYGTIMVWDISSILHKPAGDVGSRFPPLKVPTRVMSFAIKDNALFTGVLGHFSRSVGDVVECRVDASWKAFYPGGLGFISDPNWTKDFLDGISRPEFDEFQKNLKLWRSSSDAEIASGWEQATIVRVNLGATELDITYDVVLDPYFDTATQRLDNAWLVEGIPYNGIRPVQMHDELAGTKKTVTSFIASTARFLDQNVLANLSEGNPTAKDDRQKDKVEITAEIVLFQRAVEDFIDSLASTADARSMSRESSALAAQGARVTIDTISSLSSLLSMVAPAWMVRKVLGHGAASDEDRVKAHKKPFHSTTLFMWDITTLIKKPRKHLADSDDEDDEEYAAALSSTTAPSSASVAASAAVSAASDAATAAASAASAAAAAVAAAPTLSKQKKGAKKWKLLRSFGIAVGLAPVEYSSSDLKVPEAAPDAQFMLREHFGGVSTLTFEGKDKEFLFSGSYDSTVCVWDMAPVARMERPAKLARITGFRRAVHCVYVSDGDRLYASTSDYNIEERMMPLKISRLPDKTAMRPPDDIQHEHQDLDNAMIPLEKDAAMDLLWREETPIHAKSLIHAAQDLVFASCSLFAETYHSGRCDARNRYVEATDFDFAAGLGPGALTTIEEDYSTSLAGDLLNSAFDGEQDKGIEAGDDDEGEGGELEEGREDRDLKDDLQAYRAVAQTGSSTSPHHMVFMYSIAFIILGFLIATIVLLTPTFTASKMAAPTANPTSLPSRVATLAPTPSINFGLLSPVSSNVPIISFSSNLVLSGLSVQQLSLRVQAAVLDATAFSMGLPSSYVQFQGAMESPSSSTTYIRVAERHREGFEQAGHFTTAAAYMCTVAVGLRVPTTLFPNGTSPTVTFIILKNELTAAVQSGSFITALRGAGQQFGCTSLTAGVTAQSVSFSSMSVIAPPVVSNTTSLQSSRPSPRPSILPSTAPQALPSPLPSAIPSLKPSLAPTFSPSQKPSAKPSPPSTAMPSTYPSLQPTMIPTDFPSLQPTLIPTDYPSLQPTRTPTDQSSV